MSPNQHKKQATQGQQSAGNMLEKDQEYFQSLFGNLLEGVQILDHDWRYLYLNTTAERHNRRPNQELLGKKYMDMWPGIEETQVFSVIKGCMEEQVAAQLENQFIFPDGAEGWFVLSIQPIPEGTFILSFDITERVRAEKQVAQMKRLYATLSQVNQTIVRIKDPGELYQSICDVSAKFGEFSLAWVGLLDEASGDVKPVAANGLDITQWPFPIVNTKTGPFQNEVISQAFLTSTVVTSKDIQTDERTQSLHNLIQEYGFHSLAVVPFRLAGRTIGVLCLISPKTGFFKSKEEILLLEEMGLDISFALDTIETERIKRQWADAFEHCAHGIAIGLPSSGQILTCNPAFARLQDRTVDEISSMAILGQYAPQDRAHVKECIAEADRTGSVRYEAHMIRKDGSTYPVQMDVVSVRDQNGTLLYRVATQQDISERKQAEQALLESWERYKSLFENNPHPMWVYDLETLAFLMVNDAAINHYGYSREEFLGMSLKDIRPEEDIPTLLTNVEQEHDRLQHSTGWRHRKKDGSLIDVEISSHALQFEGRAARLVIANDITARKRAEAERNKLAERLDLATRSANMGIWDWDIQKNELFWDDQMYALYGLKPGEFGGAYEAWLQGVHPEDRAPSNEISAQAVRGEREYDTEFRVLWPDGSVHWLKAKGQVFRDEQGAPLRMVGVNYDISERKQTEEALQEVQSILSMAEEVAQIGSWKWDLRTQKVTWSDEMFRLFGVEREGFDGDVNRVISERIHPDDMAAVQESNHSVLEDTHPIPLSYRIILPDGTERRVWAQGKLVRDEAEQAIALTGYVQDITERRQAEEKLQANERTLKLFVEHAPAAIAMLDRNMVYIAASHRYLSDYRLPEKNIIGRSHYEIFPEIPERWKEIHKRCLAGATEIDEADPFLRMDGSLDWIRWEIHPWYEQSGEIGGILLFSEVITERRQAQEQLRESEKKYRDLINGMNDTVWVIDFDTTILDVNHTASTVLGYTREELLSMKISAIDVDLTPEQIQNLASNMPRDNFQVFETWHTAKDGKKLPVEVSSGFVSYMGKTAIMSIARDITERRQAQEQLRESEERFRSLYENATVGIYRTTPDGQILLANPTLVNLLGYSSFEELAQRNLEQDGYSPSYERIAFRQQVESNDKVIGLESAWMRKDGSAIFVRESARVIRDDTGKPIYYEGTVEDITERKRAEEALQLSEERHRQISNLISDYVYSGIVFPDGAARTEWVSGAIEQMTGYTVEEINQLPAGFSTLVLPEDLKRTFGEMSGSLEKESSKIEYRIRRRDGQIRWFRDFMDYQPGEGSGAAVRMIGAVQDITEQVRVEREIRERTEDLLIINALNEAINRGENFQSIVEVFARETRDVFACNDVSVYLLNQDGKYIEMQNSTLSARITEKIEKLIGRPIPKIQLPVRPGSYFAITMENDQGYITSDPKVIQEWIEEFTETTFLPTVMRPVIRKIVPQIYKALNIKSVMSVPLISSGQTIGILDMSSKGLFTNEDLHRIRSISHQMTAAIMRKQAEEEVQLQLRRMGALSDIDRAISSSLDMRVSLEVVLTEVLSQLKVDACAVLLFNEISFMLEYYAGKGFRTSGIRQSRVRLGEGIAGRVGLERKLVHLSNLVKPDPQFTRKGLVKDESFVEYFAVPLVAKGMLKGVLEIFHRTPLHPDLDWISYLETLGGQTAIAIDNAQLFEGMQKSNLELIAAYDATIAGWSHAMDLRDKETEGHSQRVTDLTLKLAERLGVSDQEQVHIRRGALLHDIGKLGVPDQILLKPGQLTADDWSLMRQHPTYAFEMLSPINYLRPALDIPYCHHEKWDGTGYPRGLKGEQIPMAARIFAVVDVWDALRSDRPYRKAWDEEKALNYIRAEAGKHFDPHIVRVFLDFIRST